MFSTGGITQKNAAPWLQLSNVFYVGGSWIAPRNLITPGNWDAISALAQTAAQLSSHPTNARSTT
ncbi:hypothetical protein [Bartonella quintana]|uniref:hypothetical protein n=1 Tax=Bartonella quintana TaxID=803 RepID=UPI003B00EEBB